jgi:hypothetical protein
VREVHMAEEAAAVSKTSVPEPRPVVGTVHDVPPGRAASEVAPSGGTGEVPGTGRHAFSSAGSDVPPPPAADRKLMGEPEDG